MGNREPGPREERPSARLLCTTDGNHRPIDGSVVSVAEAVRRGGDLRRFSTYHLEGTGLVEETMALQATWVFDDQNVGGFQTLRHPVDAALGISMQPSLAVWIFGAGTPQRSTFIPLDGTPMQGATGQWVKVENDAYASVGEQLAPTQYQWWTRSGWEQICAHDEKGHPASGSWEKLREAVNDGCALKVGVKNLWSYLTPAGEVSPEHEVFIECTTHFSHLDEEFFGALTQPTLLLRPCLPLKFLGEDFAIGWLVVRSDGRIQRQTLNPSSMQWERAWGRRAVRWFARDCRQQRACVQ